MLPDQNPNAGMDPSMMPMQPLYEYKNRPRRDICAGISYLVLLAVVVIFGFVAFGTANKDFKSYSSDFYAHSTSCDVNAFNAKYVPPSANTTDTTNDSFNSAFSKAALVWVPISAVFGIAFSVLYLYLFKRFALQMVYITIWLSLAWSLALAIIAFASGGVAVGVITIILTIVMAVVFLFARNSLRVCAKLLSVAGQGLCEVPAIIPTAIVTKIVGVGILLFLFAAFVFALYNGKAVKGAYVTKTGSDENATCYDAMNNVVNCCGWSVNGWAIAYCVFNWICISWTAFTLLQFKLYIVADSIAQWYFLPALGSNGYAPDQHPSVKRAVRNGLTSSWGSICFAGLILAIIDFLKSAMDNAARHQDNTAAKVICCILNCILQPLLAMLEKFTRFATIATAITGQSFVSAAKQVYNVLKRNLLRTISVWWVPDYVLGSAVLLFSLGWACIVFGLSMAQLHSYDSSTATGASFLVAALCFLECYYLLMFMAGLLLDIVNTVYICFSIDRDAKRVTKPEIHTIYTAVPTIAGALVENPDGGYAYGAPEAPAGPHTAPAQQPQPTYGGYPAAMGYNAGGAYPAANQPFMAGQPYPPSYATGPYPAVGQPQPGAYPPMGQPAPGSYGYGAPYGSNNV